jgi:dienelactone hydrolase
MGAIGFCFGGLCALDLARSGVDIRAVVSFHGLLGAPEGVEKGKIKAKVLAMHGYADPMVKSDQVAHFEQEMTKGNVDWQMHIFGNTMHAFTNPQANDPSFGLVYNEAAARRSWLAMENFFKEVL